MLLWTHLSHFNKNQRQICTDVQGGERSRGFNMRFKSNKTEMIKKKHEIKKEEMKERYWDSVSKLLGFRWDQIYSHRAFWSSPSVILGVFFKNRGLAFRKDHDYAQVWITQRARGANALGPQTIKGPDNPLFHTAQSHQELHSYWTILQDKISVQ